MNQNARVLVIVVTFNGWRLLEKCLRSLSKAVASPHGVLVVDNGSTDGTAEMVRKKFPRAGLLRLEENLGWSGGNNAGIKKALAEDYTHVLLLNNDVTVEPDFIRVMLQAFQSRPGTVMANPLIRFMSRPEKICFAGGFRKWTGSFVSRGYLEKDTGQYGSVEEIEWANGCALMASCEAVRKIGLVSKDYFLRFEDVDWSLRAREAGGLIVLVPGAVIYHAISASFGPEEINPFHAYYSFRNELTCIRRHDTGLKKIISIACCLANHILLGLGHSSDVKRALLAGVTDALTGRLGKAGRSVARLWQVEKT